MSASSVSSAVDSVSASPVSSVVVSVSDSSSKSDRVLSIFSSVVISEEVCSMLSPADVASGVSADSSVSPASSKSFNCSSTTVSTSSLLFSTDSEVSGASCEYTKVSSPLFILSYVSSKSLTPSPSPKSTSGVSTSFTSAPTSLLLLSISENPSIQNTLRFYSLITSSSLQLEPVAFHHHYRCIITAC